MSRYQLELVHTKILWRLNKTVQCELQQENLSSFSVLAEYFSPTLIFEEQEVKL